MKPKYNERHGGPYDRGRADSYYRRGREPHYFIGGSYNSPRIVDLTTEELDAYHAGFDDNERDCEFKDWGN